MHRNYYIVYLLLLVCAFTACTPRSIREAQSIVAQADSLRAKGCVYIDSAELAQAYETLGQWQWFYTDEYTHTCYHYGKLLRAKENPVEAMQAFISATHSRTRDYHILGRVYSNMGDMCHLAGEFQLSFNMFSRSADCFLRSGDTIAYYYLLNDMAFEKAMLSDEESTYTLIGILEECEIIDFRLKILELESELYLRSQRYDSARQKALELLKSDANNTLGILVLAQSYSFSHQKDSAAYYAEMLLQKSQNISDIHNALYILTNDDESKSKESIRKVAADRSDIQMRLKDRQGKLSQAVQLLDQDLHRKPDYRWLYAILATLVIVGASIYTYIYRKRRQHALLSQRVEDLAIQNIEAETQHEKILGDIEKHKRTITDEIEKNCQSIIKAESFPQNIYWKDFNKMRASIDCQFYMIATKLSKKNILNETEIRLCILVLLNLSRVDISKTLPYASSSVGKLKDQTAKKLNTTGKHLRDYLIKMAIE